MSHVQIIETHKDFAIFFVLLPLTLLCCAFAPGWSIATVGGFKILVGILLVAEAAQRGLDPSFGNAWILAGFIWMAVGLFRIVFRIVNNTSTKEGEAWCELVPNKSTASPSEPTPIDPLVPSKSTSLQSEPMPIDPLEKYKKMAKDSKQKRYKKRKKMTNCKDKQKRRPTVGTAATTLSEDDFV